MSLKINPIVSILLLVGIIILMVAFIHGCNKSKKQVAAKEKALVLADSALAVLKEYKATGDSTEKQFRDTIEFERGQNKLIEAQKERTEVEMDVLLKQNKNLIAKHKLAKYTDTSAVLVPGEYLTDCEGCFTNLETTTGLYNRYRSDMNKLQDNWDRQSEIYQNRFKELDAEKTGFYNKISSLVKQQKEADDKLKPHGRLYLSWGVVWGPWPKMAGAGLLYQTKYNIQYGAKWYYGNQGHMVETNINFPLSLKFR